MSNITRYSGDTSEYNTLAHELIAKEEQNISIFFAAFAIQLYLSKDIIQNEMKTPFFIQPYSDIELHASQRLLIRNIIINPNYKAIVKEIENIFKLTEGNKNPDNIFFHKLNKAFLIRQIFNQTDQVLKKYHFINKFVGCEFYEFDLDTLYKEMKSLTIAEQILILIRIFSNTRDDFEYKKKTIGSSFVENIQRKKQECIKKGHQKTLKYSNIERLLANFK